MKKRLNRCRIRGLWDDKAGAACYLNNSFSIRRIRLEPRRDTIISLQKERTDLSVSSAVSPAPSLSADVSLSLSHPRSLDVYIRGCLSLDWKCALWTSRFPVAVFAGTCTTGRSC